MSKTIKFFCNMLIISKTLKAQSLGLKETLKKRKAS